MTPSMVNPPPAREFNQKVMATLFGFCGAFLLSAAVSQHDAGAEVSPWAWVGVGFFAVAAVTIYEWHVLWRAMHPPLTLAPDTVPASFDWGTVSHRMNAYYDTQEGAEASPEESDSVYLATRDAVILAYVDVVRDMFNSYEGLVSWHPIDPELGTDQSGRAGFVGCKDVWKLDPAVVLPSPHRRELILVDRIDAEARLRADGPWRWTVIHGRTIDPATGEVADRPEEFFTAPGVGDMFGPRQVIGFTNPYPPTEGRPLP